MFVLSVLQTKYAHTFYACVMCVFVCFIWSCDSCLLYPAGKACRARRPRIRRGCAAGDLCGGGVRRLAPLRCRRRGHDGDPRCRASRRRGAGM